MSEIGRPHPAVERYVSKAVSPNERIEALEAEVERLTRELEAKHRAWNHAVEEGARLGRERDEARARADGLAKAAAAATALIENHDAWLARQDVLVLDIDSEWTRLVDALRAALAALPKEDDRE